MVPSGYHSTTPCLIIEEAPKLIQFMKQTFEAEGGEAMERIRRPNHARRNEDQRLCRNVSGIDLRNKVRWQSGSTFALKTSTDVQARGGFKCDFQAKPAEQSDGDRTADSKTPSSNYWRIAQRVEEVLQEEMEGTTNTRSQD